MPPLASFPHVSVRNHFITLHCSDGSPSNRPTMESSAIREDGTVDYMDECIGDDPSLKHWKMKIGTFLAQSVLDLPDAGGRRKYILSALPRGYSLFVHKKGDRYNPRTDAYLWGSATVNVFRSPAEFFFHAKWLLLGCPKPDPSSPSDPDEDLFGPPPPEELEDRCGCKYCAGVDQSYISRNFSNYTPHGKAKANKQGRVTVPVPARFEGIPMGS